MQIVNKKELKEIYDSLSDGQLKDKIHLALYPDEKTIEMIKQYFPNADSIWKCNHSNKYVMKFFLKDDEELDLRFSYLIEVEKLTNNPGVKIDFLEFREKDRGTLNDWMYSSYDLIWENHILNK